MTRTAFPAVFLVCTLFPQGHAQAVGNSAWLGHWTLNRAASHFVGVAVSIKRLTHSYQFDLGGMTLNIGDDGKDYPTTTGRTTSFKELGKDRWLRVHKLNGKTLDTSTFMMAADGQSFVVRTVQGGQIKASNETFMREGSGTGIDGVWRSTSGGINAATAIDITPVGAAALRVAYPSQQMWFVSQLNGSAVSYAGPLAVPNVQVVVSRISPTLLRWVDVVRGKRYMEGTYRLTSNNRRLTEQSWHVTSPQDKDEAVYDRE